MPSADPGAPTVRPADVERWLTDLGLEPVDRAERDGIASWDLVLDGRRRFDLRVTIILDPALALICWAHFAPPISDMFRKSYRKLLRWNDEFPFAKFSIGEDERPLLAIELPIADAASPPTADQGGLAVDRREDPGHGKPRTSERGVPRAVRRSPARARDDSARAGGRSHGARD